MPALLSLGQTPNTRDFKEEGRCILAHGSHGVSLWLHSPKAEKIRWRDMMEKAIQVIALRKQGKRGEASKGGEHTLPSHTLASPPRKN